MKVYIAGPLFNAAEKSKNRELRDLLREKGFETYLPQEDGGISFDQIKSGGDVKATRTKVFQMDIEQIRSSDMMVCVLDGRVPDEGMCIELGIAYSMGKVCIGFLTDHRTLDPYGMNLMIEGCLSSITHSTEELIVAVQKI